MQFDLTRSKLCAPHSICLVPTKKSKSGTTKAQPDRSDRYPLSLALVRLFKPLQHRFFQFVDYWCEEMHVSERDLLPEEVSTWVKEVCVSWEMKG
jgi:hypothetical protein